MEMEKKNVAIIILAIALIASGVGNIILVLQPEVFPPPPVPTVTFGTMYIVQDADPQYMWDSASFDFALHIWETLFAYNLTAPDLALIPRLATTLGEYNTAGDELTVPLKEGVLFHDETPFNAAAVKFSFDRLAYLMNITGTLVSDVYAHATIISSLYSWPDGTPVINRTEIVDPYTIRFVLNRAYGPFRALLTFQASDILSPTSTPADDYIPIAECDVDDDDDGVSDYCVGTGPFMLETFLADYEVRFNAFDDYHRGRAEFDKLIMANIQDSDARNLAVMIGDVDIITDPQASFHPDMEADETLNLFEADIANTIIQYLGMNNKLINETWREAISYAFNYSYVTDVIMEYTAVRLKSPVPMGIKYADYSFDVATFDVEHARTVMKDMFPDECGGYDARFPGDSEDDWSDLSLAAFNYTYNTGNYVRESIYRLLEVDMDRIGIDITEVGIEWGEFLDLLYDIREPEGPYGFDSLALYFVGWMPDYNDPSNFINPLMSNVSHSNSAQVNDPYLESLMLQGLEETTPAARELIYREAQRHIVETIRPWCFVYQGINYDCLDVGLKGFPHNPMGYNYFYECYWE